MKYSAASYLWVAVLALVMAACEAPAEGRPLRMERNAVGVIFQDPIDDRAVDALEAELRPGDRLLIDSQSGQRDAALRLGRIVVERRIHVTVNGSCFSVCALYVFLPARTKDVPKGTWVWFDVSPYAWNRVLESRPDLFSDQERSEFAQHFQQYEALLAQGGATASLLDCIDGALELDVTEARRGLQISPGTVSRNLIIPSRFQSVALSRDMLESFGASIEGDFWWPTREGERRAISEAHDTRVVWVDRPEQCAGAF